MISINPDVSLYQVKKLIMPKYDIFQNDPDKTIWSDTFDEYYNFVAHQADVINIPLDISKIINE